MSIRDWKVYFDSEVVGQVLSFKPAIDQTMIVTKSLSGGIYIQTIGTGTKTAKVEVFVTNEERDAINNAQSIGGLISIVYSGKQYVGYIEEPPDWSEKYPGKYYTAELSFLIEEEV
jgi:hypothetical protein